MRIGIVGAGISGLAIAVAAEGEGVVSLLEPDKDIEDGSEVH